MTTTDIETQSLALVEAARSFRVVDFRTCEEADRWWKQLDQAEKEAHAFFDPTVKATDKAHKDAVAMRARVIDPLVQMKSALKRMSGDWRAEQERIRLAEEARLREEARRAEEARRQAELKAAEEARRAEEERLLAEARKAEAEGNKVKAEAILETAVQQVEVLKQEEQAIAQEPIVPPTVTVPKTTPKIQGGPVYREVWDCEVTDFMALVRAVVDGKASLSFLKPDTIALRQQAQSLKSNLNIPGVKAVSRRV